MALLQWLGISLLLLSASTFEADAVRSRNQRDEARSSALAAKNVDHNNRRMLKVVKLKKGKRVVNEDEDENEVPTKRVAAAKMKRRAKKAVAEAAIDAAGEGGANDASDAKVESPKVLLETTEEIADAGVEEKSEGEQKEIVVVKEEKASETEDSGNSGVAEEIALVGNAGATADASADGENSSVEETPVVAVSDADLDKVEEEVAIGFSKEDAMKLEEEVHADEEDYISFMSELMGFADKINPTIQAVRDKTAKHVVPTIALLAKSGHNAFQHTSKTLYQHIEPYAGSTFSPILATLLSLTLLLLPLCLIIALVYKLRVIFTVQKVLLLANLYLCLYCFALLFTCIIISGEPMIKLRVAAESNYFALQIVQCFGYILYLGLQFTNLFLTLKRKEADHQPLLVAAIQCAAAVGIGLHYYVTVFERAMLDRSPRTSGVAYLIYCIVFAVLTLLTRRPKDTKNK